MGIENNLDLARQEVQEIGEDRKLDGNDLQNFSELENHLRALEQV